MKKRRRSLVDYVLAVVLAVVVMIAVYWLLGMIRGVTTDEVKVVWAPSLLRPGEECEEKEAYLKTQLQACAQSGAPHCEEARRMKEDLDTGCRMYIGNKNYIANKKNPTQEASPQRSAVNKPTGFKPKRLVDICVAVEKAWERDLQDCALGRWHLCNAARRTADVLAKCVRDGLLVDDEARMPYEASICAAVKKGWEDQSRNCALGEHSSCRMAGEMEKDFDAHCNDQPSFDQREAGTGDSSDAMCPAMKKAWQEQLQKCAQGEHSFCGAAKETAEALHAQCDRQPAAARE